MNLRGQFEKFSPPDFKFVQNVIIIAIIHDPHFLTNAVAVSDDERNRRRAYFLVGNYTLVAFGARVFHPGPTFGKRVPGEYLLPGGATGRGRRFYADAPVELADVDGFSHYVGLWFFDVGIWSLAECGTKDQIPKTNTKDYIFFMRCEMVLYKFRRMRPTFDHAAMEA